jgi:hypothetical protein
MTPRLLIYPSIHMFAFQRFLHNTIQKTARSVKSGFTKLQIIEMVGGSPQLMLLGAGIGVSAYVMKTKTTLDGAGILLFGLGGSLLIGKMPATSAFVAGIVGTSVLSTQVLVTTWNKMVYGLKASQNRLA